MRLVFLMSNKCLIKSNKYIMTIENKPKRAAYFVEYKNNLSRFQKEKRRLKNNEYRKQARLTWSAERLAKQADYNANYYLKNKTKSNDDRE